MLSDQSPILVTGGAGFIGSHFVLDWFDTVGTPLVNLDKLTYYGLSTGAYLGNILLAVESRIKVAVLLGGGFDFSKKLPEVDEINFAPRVKVPTLMVNGLYDHFFPYEKSQKVMLQFLGTHTKDKRHAVFEAGHIPPHDQMIKEILDWLDRYQGPVK